MFVLPVIREGYSEEFEPIASGQTDADGRYNFEDVTVNVREFQGEAVPKPTQALFQIYGFADGYGYAWRRPHGYRPEARPIAPDKPATPIAKKSAKGRLVDGTEIDEDDLTYVFFAGDPIVVDLKLSAEVKLYGTITNDRGAPLKDAVVQVGSVNDPDDLPGTLPSGSSVHYFENLPRGVDGQFEGAEYLP